MDGRSTPTSQIWHLFGTNMEAWSYSLALRDLDTLMRLSESPQCCLHKHTFDIATFDAVCLSLDSYTWQRLQTEFGVSGTVLSWIQSYRQDRKQFVKLGEYRSPEGWSHLIEVGVPQGSVYSLLGPLLFAVYCSPVADVIASHGVRYHQYADDTQLHLAMRADNTADGMSVLALYLYHHRCQTLVHAERTPAEPGQIRGTAHGNDQPVL